MSDLIAIRAYGEADLDAAIAIFQRAVREIASANYTPAQIEAWARVDRAAFAAQRRAQAPWIALREHAPAGFAELEPGGRVAMLYTDPDHQRAGVARALLARIEGEAARLGLDAVSTEASITAKPFFEAQGFRVVAPETIAREGQSFLRYRMRKDLVRRRPAPDR